MAVGTPQHNTSVLSINVAGLSPEAIRTIRSLVERLRSEAAAGKQAADWSLIERQLDTDYHNECEADQWPEVTLTEVRAGLTSIPGSLRDAFAAERDER